jgi:hypothetical protein
VLKAQGGIADQDLFPGGPLRKTIKNHRDWNSGELVPRIISIVQLAAASSTRFRSGFILAAPKASDNNRHSPKHQKQKRIPSKSHSRRTEIATPPAIFKSGKGFPKEIPPNF